MSTKVGTVIIDVKADTAKLVSGMDRAEKSVSKSVDQMKATLKTLAGAYLGVSAAQKLLADGFEYNSALENAKAGLTSLSVAVQDKTIPVMERYAKANIEATDTLEKLQAINAQTPHTLNQTNQIYKAMYVSMSNAGASTSDMIELTRSLSIASGAAGIEFNSLLAGVDGLATGTVLANSDLGRFISSLGLSNEKLKESDDVVGLLNDTLKDFKAADTMTVAVSNLTNAYDQLAGELTKPLFEQSKEDMKEFTALLNDNRDDIVEFGLDTIRTAQLVANGYESIFLASKLGYTEIAYAFKDEIGSVINDVTELFVETNNYWADTWVGKKAGLEVMDFDAIKIDAQALNEEILKTRLELAGIGNENDKILDGIFKDTVAQKHLNQALKDANDIQNSSTKKKKSKKIDTSNTDTSSLDQYGYDLWLEKDKAEKESYKEKEKLEKDWAKTLQSNQLSALDNQIALVESTNSWSNSLSGISGVVQNVSKTFSKFHSDELKATKAKMSIDAKYEKSFKKFAGDEEKTKELQGQKDKELADVRTQQQANEMQGWGDLAGSMASSFEQGSAGAIAFTTIQSALGIASSWTAIAQAWAQPFPANIAAAAMVASQVMPIIGQLGGGSSSGGGVDYSASVNNLEVEQTNYDMFYDGVLGRLDRQIELLEDLNKYGTASSLNVTRAGYQFDRDEGQVMLDFKQSILDTLKDVDSETAQTAYNAFVEPYFNKDFDAVGYFNGTSELFSNNVWNSIFGFSGIVAEGTVAYNDALGSFQQAILDFSTSIIDSINDLQDASTDFASAYDAITGTNKYESFEYEQAYNEVYGNIGDESLESYLERQIANISTLDSLLSKEDVALMLSQDTADMQAQIDLNNSMADVLGEVFADGAEEALNMKDSISIVADVLANSTANIKDFEDSFKSQEELAQDLSDAIGYPLATTEDGLFDLFETLKGGIDGLTDSELEFLNSNKDLISSLEDAQQSLNDWADGIFDNQKLSTLGAQYSISALNAAISGYADATDKQVAADNIIKYANDAIDYTKATSGSLADYNFQSAVIANSVRDVEQIDIGSFKSVEDAINEQTAVLSNLLDDIKDNTQANTVENI